MIITKTMQGNLEDIVRAVHDAFANADMSRFRIEFKAEGRVHSKPEVSWTVSAHGWGQDVQGRDLNEAVRECLRREGWTERNKPLELDYLPQDDTLTDEDLQYITENETGGNA